MEVMVFVAVGLFVAAVVLFVYFAYAHKMPREGQAYVYQTKVITNKGGFVFLPSPRRVLDLAPRPITTTVNSVRTEDDRELTVTLDADISVPDDADAIRTAAGHFAGAEHTIDAVAGELLEAAVTAIAAASAHEQVSDRVTFAAQVRTRANAGLATLGLTLDVVTISSLVSTPDELLAR